MRCIAKFDGADIDVLYDGHSDYVTLRFQSHETEDYVDTVFNRFNLPSLFEGILRATRTEQPTAIRGDHLDGLVVPEGHMTQRLSDGNIELKVLLRTDDGVRSIPWTMSAEAARELAAELTQFSSQP